MKEQLRKARKDAGLTQIELAKISGISLVTINRAENKQTKLVTYQKLFSAIQEHQASKQVQS
jgi:transcriptional regulator with XRE-family HTH domain